MNSRMTQANYVGVDMDLLAAIAEDQGFKYDLQYLGFDAAVQALESGQADGVIAGMSITPERQKKIRLLRSLFRQRRCYGYRRIQ